LFEKLFALRNNVGLFAEEYDPVSPTAARQFPLAFSHVGLINTAQNLRQKRGPAEKRARTRDLGPTAMVLGQSRCRIIIGPR
jgi:hypothetical protein